MTAPDWPCEAYGPEALQHGAWCFLAADLRARVCGSSSECSRVMAAERQRVFRRLNELAAAGDPVMADLADEFARPEQLLGGPDDQPGDHTEGVPRS